MFSKTIFKLKSPSELQCKAKTKADELLYKLIHLHRYDPFDLTMIYRLTHCYHSSTAYLQLLSGDITTNVLSHSRTLSGRGSSTEDHHPRCWVLVKWLCWMNWTNQRCCCTHASPAACRVSRCPRWTGQSCRQVQSPCAVPGTPEGLILAARGSTHTSV